MKEFIIKPGHLQRIELWAATTIFVFSIFFLINNVVDSNKHLFDQDIHFDYFSNYFSPQLLGFILIYLVFLLFNFKILPLFTEKKDFARNIAIIVAAFLLTGFILGIRDTYLKAYLFTEYPNEDDFYKVIFQKSYHNTFWLFLMIGVYSLVKYASIYLLSNSETITTKYRIVTRDGLIAFVLWMISIFVLLVGEADGEIILAWAILAPSAILFYCYSNYALLPAAFKTRKPFRTFLFKSLLVLLIAFIPVAVLILLITSNNEDGFAGSLFNSFFHLFITAPLSWVLYKRRLQNSEEVVGLQKELGQSNASLDFLRSQINPHFLFNALNTIYATSINEKAERTSEAIEQLGDMMRFMLHENIQDKISLAREIEYLNNYIGLQKLRTEHNSALEIETHIEPAYGLLTIAPMLLIPFVENAYKHGISFRESSHIRISLEIMEQTLYFDVDNSKHDKQEQDPEKNESGIGLNNVKQRLQLLYPGRHELTIRETSKQFFIHLTLQLS